MQDCTEDDGVERLRGRCEMLTKAMWWVLRCDVETMRSGVNKYKGRNETCRKEQKGVWNGNF